MVTAKHASPLPAPKQPGRLVMGARWLRGGKKRLTVLSGRYRMVE